MAKVLNAHLHHLVLIARLSWTKPNHVKHLITSLSLSCTEVIYNPRNIFKEETRFISLIFMHPQCRCWSESLQDE